MKGLEKIIPIEITINEKIPYIDRINMYGRAEFEICPVFKYGRLTDLYLYRRQQPDVKPEAYHLNPKKERPNMRIDCFEISAWSHTEEPYIWRNWWCKEHKCVAFDTYVPPKTNKIEFQLSFGTTITIRFVG